MLIKSSNDKIENLHVYTDGGSRGNPGSSAIGVVLIDENENMIHTHKECIGDGTNNQAEYTALIKALELAAGHCRRKINCFSDSELMVRQLNGLYRIKDKKLRNLFYKVKDRETAFEEVIYNHKRRENKFIKVADELVNSALDDKPIEIQQ